VTQASTTLPLVEQFQYGLDAPICLTWELTYACNLACVHCLSSSGRRDPRELSTAQCQAVIDELQRMFYDFPHPRRWARHAPAVLDADDPAARSIAVEAAQALAGLADSAMRRLAAPAGLPVVLGGGLMGHPRLREAAIIAVRGVLPGHEVRALTDPPVAGAVRLAGAAAQRVRVPGTPASS